jgi:uroporphyrinogen-III synthase
MPEHASEPARVLVTRTADQAVAFSQKLRAAGFAPVEFPAIQLQPLPWEPLDAALAELNSFDWLIFTSVNAADFFLHRADEQAVSLAGLPRVAAVGSATAARLAERGIAIDFMPDDFVGTELVLGLGDLAGQKVLLPRAKIGRPEITDLLQAQGAELVEVPLYDTVTAVPSSEMLAELNKGVAAITFTSPSSVRNFCKIVTANQDKFNRTVESLLAQPLIVCIGPVTASAAADVGLSGALFPAEYTIEGMVTLLKEHLVNKII